MPDAVLARADKWLSAGEPVAVATIVRIRGSSSQPLGARMVMTRDNRFEGAVSGGCVETDVYETARAVLDGGGPLMLHYKKVENPVIEIGLNCDGMIDVLVERLTPDLRDQLAGQGYALVTLCDPGRPRDPRPQHVCVTPDGTLPGAATGALALSPDVAQQVIAQACAVLRTDQAASLTLADGRVALIEPLLAPPVLWIAGAEPVAAPLAEFARIMGFRVVISDPRPAFAVPERFPAADRVVAAWPRDMLPELALDARACVVSLNHEPRFEDPLWHALADQPVRYLGAIGKPQRAIERRERAAAAGFDLDRLPPIHTPVGLDIGGKSPEEIALSIIAEIVAVCNGRTVALA